MIEFNINFLFTIINILVLFVLLKKFLFGRVEKIIEARQAEADEALKEAESAKAEALEMKEECEKTLSEVSELKREAIKKAEDEARTSSARILKQADEKAATILDQARTQGEAEVSRMMDDADSQIIDLVSEAVEKVVLNSENTDNSALLDAFLKKAGEGE